MPHGISLFSRLFVHSQYGIQLRGKKPPSASKFRTPYTPPGEISSKAKERCRTASLFLVAFLPARSMVYSFGAKSRLPPQNFAPLTPAGRNFVQSKREMPHGISLFSRLFALKEKAKGAYVQKAACRNRQAVAVILRLYPCLRPRPHLRSVQAR